MAAAYPEKCYSLWRGKRRQILQNYHNYTKLYFILNAFVLALTWLCQNMQCSLKLLYNYHCFDFISWKNLIFEDSLSQTTPSYLPSPFSPPGQPIDYYQYLSFVYRRSFKSSLGSLSIIIDTQCLLYTWYRLVIHGVCVVLGKTLWLYFFVTTFVHVWIVL